MSMEDSVIFKCHREQVPGLTLDKAAPTPQGRMG